MDGVVWGLDPGRRGEFLQILALGHALGARFQTVRLEPVVDLAAALPAGPPPDLILCFGRTAGLALRLRRHFDGRPKLVQLGTPGHAPTAAFDLVVPMPQDDYPAAPNVRFLDLPLNGATMAATALPARGDGAAGTVVLFGGGSRHYRLTPAIALRVVGFGARLARANGEALAVVTSPRTSAAVLAELRRLREPPFALQLYGEADAFARVLAAAARLVVTGDSASMVADACRAGAPVWVHPLPRRPNPMTFLQNASDLLGLRGLRHAAIRRGWIGGGTDYRRWHEDLARRGYIRLVREVAEDVLTWAPASGLPDDDLRRVVARIRAFLPADGASA